MYPILFELADLKVRSFGVLLAAGFLVGWLWARWCARRRGIDVRAVDGLLPAVIVGGVLGARAVDVFVNFQAYVAEPLRVLFVWDGGLALLGGFFGALVAGAAVLLLTRQPILEVADVCVPAAFLGLAIGRVGSFLMADDFGLPADVPWAVRFPDLEGSLLPVPLIDVPLHPAQLYHSASALALFAVTMLLLRWRRLAAGLVLGFGLGSYAVVRFGLERFRADDEARGFFGPYSTPQLLCACLGLAALGIVLLAVLRARHLRRSSPGTAMRGGV